MKNIEKVLVVISANEVSLNTTTATTTTTTTTPSPVSLALPVRSFPAFGNASNDCSVRFSSTKHEQTGYWTCAARRADEDEFTDTAPAKLSIVHAVDAGYYKILFFE